MHYPRSLIYKLSPDKVLPSHQADIESEQGIADVGDVVQSVTRPESRTRRPDRLHQWVEEQLAIDVSDGVEDQGSLRSSQVGTPPNPYLAYPHLGRWHKSSQEEDVRTLNSYVVLEQEDVLDGAPAINLDEVRLISSHPICYELTELITNLLCT
jgi:hypothetical protein